MKSALYHALALAKSETGERGERGIGCIWLWPEFSIRYEVGLTLHDMQFNQEQAIDENREDIRRNRSDLICV